VPGILIDRLTADLPSMPESQARRLAMGIVDGLAVAGLSGVVGQVPALRIDLTAEAAAEADGLAKRIISEIVRQLRQSP